MAGIVKGLPDLLVKWETELVRVSRREVAMFMEEIAERCEYDGSAAVEGFCSMVNKRTA